MSTAIGLTTMSKICLITHYLLLHFSYLFIYLTLNRNIIFIELIRKINLTANRLSNFENKSLASKSSTCCLYYLSLYATLMTQTLRYCVSSFNMENSLTSQTATKFGVAFPCLFCFNAVNEVLVQRETPILRRQILLFWAQDYNYSLQFLTLKCDTSKVVFYTLSENIYEHSAELASCGLTRKLCL